MKNYLDFEKEVKALEQEVDGLKSPFGSEGISEVDTQKIKNTQNEINEKLKETYANLNSWQKTQVARHEDRPRANFYIKKIFNDFIPLAGDRYFGDDQSVTAGFGLIDKKSVLIKTNNSSWTFSANSELKIEDSIYVGDGKKIQQNKQIVLTKYLKNIKHSEGWSLKKI